MPWKSKAQARWGNSPAGKRALGASGVKEFNGATDFAKLPSRKEASMAKKMKSKSAEKKMRESRLEKKKPKMSMMRGKKY